MDNINISNEENEKHKIFNEIFSLQEVFSLENYGTFSMTSLQQQNQIMRSINNLEHIRVVFDFNPKVKEMIHKGSSADEIKEVAISEGMVTLRQNALRLLDKGITSFQEVMRITFEN